jgi:hypothetical protein
MIKIGIELLSTYSIYSVEGRRQDIYRDEAHKYAN